MVKVESMRIPVCAPRGPRERLAQLSSTVRQANGDARSPAGWGNSGRGLCAFNKSVVDVETRMSRFRIKSYLSLGT